MASHEHRTDEERACEVSRLRRAGLLSRPRFSEIVVHVYRMTKPARGVICHEVIVFGSEMEEGFFDIQESMPESVSPHFIADRIKNRRFQESGVPFVILLTSGIRPGPSRTFSRVRRLLNMSCPCS